MASVNCADNAYYIYYTDASSGAIAIPVLKSTLDQTSFDIALIGKTRLEFGDILNANVLHLLEHFASPSANLITPDQAETYQELLAHPVIGQFWYNNNTTSPRLNVCVNNNPIEWRSLNDSSSIAGNYGMLESGEQIPLPISIDGYTFHESECTWHVAPGFMEDNEAILSVETKTNANREVICTFTTSEGSYTGIANYIIIGIKDEMAPLYSV